MERNRGEERRLTQRVAACLMLLQFIGCCCCGLAVVGAVVSTKMWGPVERGNRQAQGMLVPCAPSEKGALCTA